MARNGAGVYSLPAGSTVANGDTSDASDINTPLQDLETDMNTPRPVVAGGTGASTAANARANLGLAIGTNVQAYDAALGSLAGLSWVADRYPYTTGADTFAMGTITAAGRAILDDADAAAQRTTLGAQASDATLTSLSGLSLVSGDTLYATGADTLQRLAKGSGGRGMVENTDGSAPTWDGSPWVLLATKTASASATLDFTEFNNSVYRYYIFILENVKPATDAVTLQMRFSTNAGSSYDSGATDYASAAFVSNRAGTATGGSDGASFLQITDTNDMGNAATEFGYTGTVEIFHAASATTQTRVVARGGYDNATGQPINAIANGRRLTAQDTDAVRFLFSSGNIASGSIRMFGVAA